VIGPQKLPVRLAKPPLLETIFEIRFEPVKEAVADLLPGMLYQALGASYPDSASLPVANVPREIRNADPSLRYVAAHRLVRSDGHIFVGDRVVGVGKTAPYQGWDDFRKRIDDLVYALKKTPFIARVERFSIKSLNLLEVPQGAQLSHLNLNVTVAGTAVSEMGFTLRTEFVQDPDITILQIATNATHTQGAVSKSGVLVDIDTIKLIKESDFWDAIERQIDQVHIRAKQMFFSLLTPETIDSLGPDY